MELKKWIGIIAGLLIVAMVSVAVMPVINSNSECSICEHSLRCDNLITNCQRQCCTDGDCRSGTYDGQICGCKNGDPKIDTSAYHRDARAYLESLGYSRSWMGSSYSRDDYTLALGTGRCRYQAIVKSDNHYVRYIDGPEPNPQPRYCSNGNPDLWNPWSCVRRTIEEWHRKC